MVSVKDVLPSVGLRLLDYFASHPEFIEVALGRAGGLSEYGPAVSALASAGNLTVGEGDGREVEAVFIRMLVSVDTARLLSAIDYIELRRLARDPEFVAMGEALVKAGVTWDEDDPGYDLLSSEQSTPISNG